MGDVACLLCRELLERSPSARSRWCPRGTRFAPAGLSCSRISRSRKTRRRCACLQALERDLAQHLDFHPQESDDPVEIYVLDDRNSFIHFLKFYYPELPQRRAFFLAQGNQRVVYTYASPRLAEDLRHEATHALLRGAYGDLPLWLDEGLAEYFESDLTKPGALAERIAPITSRLEERLAAEPRPARIACRTSAR